LLLTYYRSHPEDPRDWCPIRLGRFAFRRRRLVVMLWLARSTRSSPAPAVTLHAEGDLNGLQLTVYRTIQEALTNTLCGQQSPLSASA
jgi:hypothetical protein